MLVISKGNACSDTSILRSVLSGMRGPFAPWWGCWVLEHPSAPGKTHTGGLKPAMLGTWAGHYSTGTGHLYQTEFDLLLYELSIKKVIEKNANKRDAV